MPSFTSSRIALSTLLCVAMVSGEAGAGPLFDKIFGLNQPQPSYPVGPPVPVGSAGMPGGMPGAMPGTGNNFSGGNSATGFNPASGYSSNYGGVNASGTPAYSNSYGNPSGFSSAQPAPAAGNSSYYGTYYGSSLPVIGPAGAGYPAPISSGIAAATMPSQAAPSSNFGAVFPPTVTYVPNFNTYANRAAVTYYRPMLTTDPRTGAQVVVMAPCTSYEYQAQRVPTLGRSSLYGPTAPPQFAPPQPAGLPTYTLPSGGIPIAAGTSSLVLPTARGYAPMYSTYANPYQSYQVPVGSPNPGAAMSGVAPSGSYPTSPIGASAYYGTTNGGSCGNTYSPTIPGLTAPQAPRTVLPGMPVPDATMPSSGVPGTGTSTPGSVFPGGSYPQPVYPGPSSTPSSPYPGTNPTMPSNIYPGGMVDPADVPPSLPQGDTSAGLMPRPQLRSITRQPDSGESQIQPNDGESDGLESPVLMKPIPVPDDFEHPSWKPGLLMDEDMTARRKDAVERLRVAGQSKPIHWASFQQSDNGVEVRNTQSQGLELRASAESYEGTEYSQSYRSQSQALRSQPSPPQRGQIGSANDYTAADLSTGSGLRFIEQPAHAGTRSTTDTLPDNSKQPNQPPQRLVPESSGVPNLGPPTGIPADQSLSGDATQNVPSTAARQYPALQPSQRYDTSGWKPVQ